jgi:hypothetical protein
MSDKLKIILMAGLTFVAITIFAITSARPVPAHTWIGIGGALVIGCLALGLSHQLKSDRPLVKEFVRDIGIAFVVAVVVSVVYEFSTRSIGDRETVLETINKTLSAFVPETVWSEVKDEILHRNAIRRNVELDLVISEEAVLSDGRRVSAPKGQAIMWMSYSYDLYGMSDRESQIPIRHQLAFEMWNQELQLPRFERVTVSGPTDADKRVYEGVELKKIDDGKGSIRLEGGNSVKVPPEGSKNPARITTERYELVYVPGSYNLIMPELTAKSEFSKEPTMKINIKKIPDDLQVDVDTYYAAHNFIKPEVNKNFWTFDRTMLPGQGLSFLFRNRPLISGQTAVSAKETK